jgi:hypothetical protein
MANGQQTPSNKKRGPTLENLVRGFKVGAGSVADIVGSTINGIDYWVNGIGTSDSRGVSTVSKQIIESNYSANEKQQFWSGYVPRILGTVSGAVGTAGALFGAYTLAPIAGLAIPTALGSYGVLQAAAKYSHDFIFGDNGEKASFQEGIDFGWERGTHLNILQPLEGALTGRGYNNSTYRNKVTATAGKMRRNLSSILGSVVGEIGGRAASILSFGLFPTAKSINATYHQAFA